MSIEDQLRILREGSIIHDVKKEIKVIYFGVTEKEIKNGFIEYNSSYYTHKGVNTTLDGLKRFIKIHNLQDDIKSYAVIPIEKFNVDKSIYPNKKYDMLSVKLPFKIRISDVHKL